MFNVYDTINVRGVDGYASDGSTVTPGVDLMLYVVALDASSGLPVVVAINGKKAKPGRRGMLCSFYSGGHGLVLYGQGRQRKPVVLSSDQSGAYASRSLYAAEDVQHQVYRIF